MKRSIVNIILLILLFINTIVFAVQFNNLNFISKLIPITVDIILLIILSLSLYFLYRNIIGDLKYKKAIFII